MQGVTAISADGSCRRLQVPEMPRPQVGTRDASMGVMKRIITLTALALGLSSGVALADRHGGGWRGGNGPTVRDHRDFGRSDRVVIRNNDRVVNRGSYRGGWNRGDRYVRVECSRPVW